VLTAFEGVILIACTLHRVFGIDHLQIYSLTSLGCCNIKKMAFAPVQDFLKQQHLAPLLSTVNQSLVTLNKWSTVGQALQASRAVRFW
jgi:hypothetical protein